MTKDFDHLTEDYQRIEGAIEFLEANFRDQPSLEEIGASVHLSKHHFQRLFKRWAGVSPTQFLHYLTIEYAKERLRESSTVFDASLDVGLSSASRLHDLFVTFEAMTPGEYKHRGTGLEITYGFHPTPFGECLVATTPQGICALRFTSGSRDEILAELKTEWEQAVFMEAPGRTTKIVQQLFAAHPNTRKKPFHLLLKGTNFQVQVWQALLEIPSGALISYQDVANHISRPTATRAVANAIAHNPVGYLIPCHRVISKVGKAHRYRWGAARKKAILGWEASLREVYANKDNPQPKSTP